jgi:oligopeptide/dipeptide ABC transporter ATP-binding protein
MGRTILQLERLTEGQIIFQEKDISRISKEQQIYIKKEMQMIFQDPYASLNPRQRIGNAIEEPMIIHTDMSKNERNKRVQNLLAEVGLKPNHADKYPHEFSGGQRQRIGIARAIALNPKFIVCDEPVSALDVSVQAQIIKLLKQIQEKHDLTYLFISHDLGVVRHFCNRVLVMYLGHMVEMAPVEKLYESPLHPYTEALLSAIPRPNLNNNMDRVRLKGELPSPTNIPSGCPFHTRCPIAKEKCREEVPRWKEISQGHFVACHER